MGAICALNFESYPQNDFVCVGLPELWPVRTVCYDDVFVGGLCAVRTVYRLEGHYNIPQKPHEANTET